MAKKNKKTKRQPVTSSAKYKDLEKKNYALKQRAKNMVANTTGKGAMIEQAFATAVGGGIAAGAVKKYGMDDVMGIDGQAVAPAVGVGAAVFLLPKGRMSRWVLGAASGLGACAIKDLTVDMWK